MVVVAAFVTVDQDEDIKSLSMEFKTNPCIRCGKERIRGKEKTFFAGATKTKLTMYICPDKECQEKVEAGLAAKEERKLSFTKKRNPHPPKAKSK